MFLVLKSINIASAVINTVRSGNLKIKNKETISAVPGGARIAKTTAPKRKYRITNLATLDSLRIVSLFIFSSSI